MNTPSQTLALRSLPLASRLVLACFLLSVGLGYCSAIAQLHFHVASAGKLVPDVADNVFVYNGQSGTSQMERLLVAEASKPFNGQGSMRAAFTSKSAGWKVLSTARPGNPGPAKSPLSLMEIMLEANANHSLPVTKETTAEGLLQFMKETDGRLLFNGDPSLGTMRPAFLSRSSGWKRDTRKKAVADLEKLWAEREGERLVLLDWIQAGLKKAPFDEDKHPLGERLAQQPITDEFVEMGENGQRFAKIQSLVYERCTRCHKGTGGGSAAHFPLETYEEFALYCEKPSTSSPQAPAKGHEGGSANLWAQREGERLAVLAWIRHGAPKGPYDQDRLLLEGDLAQQPLTPSFVVVAEKTQQRYARLQSIWAARCTRCHAAEVGGAGAHFPLDTYERIKAYCVPETSSGMSMAKLSQTTHVHLLGFAVLYAMTGLIFSFTSYHWAVRLVLSPWPLFWQVIDIGGWWLTRYDPAFAKLIVFSGGLVGLGLLAQIVLGLLNMFSQKGKIVVLLLLLAGALGLGVAKLKVIDPYLQSEQVGARG